MIWLYVIFWLIAVTWAMAVACAAFALGLLARWLWRRFKGRAP